MNVLLFAVALLLGLPLSAAQSATPTSVSATAPGDFTGGASASTSPARASSSSGATTTTTAAGSSSSTTSPPDVLLRVPNLSVGRIELDVENLQAQINLEADVASLVTINAGVQVGISKVNITIADVEAELELIVRLGNLVDIVNRTLSTLDLNPTLISILNSVTDVVTEVVGAVDGLLGSITQGDSTTLNFIIDNLGNIVQEVAGGGGSGALATIVGNYQQNMTFTGAVEALAGGLTQRTYAYDALGATVDIVFNALGQVVQATAVRSSSSSSTASAAAATSTAAARRRG